jgi:aminoglycoside phosphotransferase (APT) family kinase protein
VLDSGSDVEAVAGLAKGRFLLQALVRTVAVVVPGELGQDLAEMPMKPGSPQAADGDTLLHGDINTSNLLISQDQKVWLIDWAQPARGAAWIDVADLIPQLILAGHNPAQAEEALATVPAWTATPPAVITSYATACAGYWARNSRLAAPPGVPRLRGYQARAAQAALTWTAHRTNWP